MDGTGPVRPVAGPNVSPAPRQESEQQTALPRAKAVTPAERTGEPAKVARQQQDAPERKKVNDNADTEKVRRQVEFDPETRDLLLKLIDKDTGMVRWQIPAETMMNMRTYVERAEAESAREDAELDAQATQRLSRAI